MAEPQTPKGTGVWHPAAVRSAASTSQQDKADSGSSCTVPCTARRRSSSGAAADDEGRTAPTPHSMPVGSPLSASTAQVRPARQLCETQRPNSTLARRSVEAHGGGWHGAPARARTASTHSSPQQLSQCTAGNSHAAQQLERHSSVGRGWATDLAAPAVPTPRRHSSCIFGTHSARISMHRAAMAGSPQKQPQPPAPADHPAASPTPHAGQLLQLDEWSQPLVAHASHSGPLPAVAGVSSHAMAPALHGCISEPLMQLDLLHGGSSEQLPSPHMMAGSFGQAAGLQLLHSSLDDAIAASSGLVLGWDGSLVAQQPPGSPQTMVLAGDMEGVAAALQKYSNSIAGGNGVSAGSSLGAQLQLGMETHWAHGSSPQAQLMQHSQHHRQQQQQQHHQLQENITQLRQARQRLAVATATLLNDNAGTLPGMGQHAGVMAASPSSSMLGFNGQLEPCSSVGAGGILPDPPGLAAASGSGIVLSASPPSQLPVPAQQPLAQLGSSGASVAGSPATLAAEVAANKLQQLLHIQQRQRELKDELLQLLPLID